MRRDLARVLSWALSVAAVMGAIAVACTPSETEAPEAPVCPVKVPVELCGTAIDWPGRCAQAWPDSVPLVVLPGSASSSCYPPVPFSLFVGRLPCGPWTEVELWCAR